VDTNGNGGKIDVRFTPLTDAQRNGSATSEITYRYSLTSGGGSGSIPAGGGVVAAANGTQTSVVVWAVSSRSTSAGDASAPSNAVNPYGLAFAPNVNGSKSSGVGDKTVSWTWNQPDGNGRAVTGYQISLDNGAWQDTTQRSFSKSVGYAETHKLEVRAISGGQQGRIGSDTSSSGAAPPPPGPKLWNVTVRVNSCLEEAKGSGDHWSSGTCTSYMMPQGSNLGLECYRDGWGSSRWYYIYERNGSRWTNQYRFIRADTITGSTAGMGSCPASY